MSSPSFPTFLHSLIPESLQPFVLLSYPISPLSKPFYSSFPISKLFTTSKTLPTRAETLYSKGPNDILFVAFWAVGFTILREVIMRFVLSPFVKWWVGSGLMGEKEDRKMSALERRIMNRERRRLNHVATRFSEQGWSFLYCSVFWTIGFTILSKLPSPLSSAQLWGTYPYNPIPGLTKFYYLAQLGFWFHQIYVIFSEQRRKDHWQMFSHHIITIALMSTSYISNFTRVGTLIHTLMDFCDILLPLAKMLRYLSLSTACDATFVLFLVSWLITREIGFFLVIRSVTIELPRYVPFQWSPQTGRYLTRNTWLGFVTLLSVLQVLLCIWFWMACRVAWRVVKGQGAEDVRSDDEEESESVDGEGDELCTAEVKICQMTKERNGVKGYDKVDMLRAIPDPHTTTHTYHKALDLLPTPSPTPLPPSTGRKTHSPKKDSKKKPER